LMVGMSRVGRMRLVRRWWRIDSDGRRETGSLRSQNAVEKAA
jgi:hypothetical protein